MKVKKIQTTLVSVKLTYAEALAISRYIHYTDLNLEQAGMTEEEFDIAIDFGKAINPATKDVPK